MIHCFILDDEQHAIDNLSDYVAQTPYLSLTGTATNALTHLERLRQNDYDLLFLDIHMPGITGIDLLKIINKPVILTTAHSEYALDGFEHGVIDYLLKPITYPRFLKATQKAQDILQIKTGSVPDRLKPKDYLFIKGEHKGKQIKLSLPDLLYIEAAKNYIVFHTDTSKYMTAMNMKEAEQLLPEPAFIRIHNSYIVALASIAAIDGNQVLVKKKKETQIIKLPIGTTYKSRLMQLIN